VGQVRKFSEFGGVGVFSGVHDGDYGSGIKKPRRSAVF
jgi:hypothetical protein